MASKKKNELNGQLTPAESQGQIWLRESINRRALIGKSIEGEGIIY